MEEREVIFIALGNLIESLLEVLESEELNKEQELNMQVLLERSITLAEKYRPTEEDLIIKRPSWN